MSAIELLGRLAEMGASARPIPPDTLRVRWPADVRPDPAFVEELKAAKPEILEVLLASTSSARVPHPCACCGRFFFPEPAAICYWCRSR